MEALVATVVLGMFFVPVGIASWEVIRSPDATWRAIGRDKTLWMGALMFPLFLSNVIAAALYFTLVRSQLRAQHP